MRVARERITNDLAESPSTALNVIAGCGQPISAVLLATSLSTCYAELRNERCPGDMRSQATVTAGSLRRSVRPRQSRVVIRCALVLMQRAVGAI